MKQIIGENKAVSYTHLDVYKRQVKHRVMCINNNMSKINVSDGQLYRCLINVLRDNETEYFMQAESTFKSDDKGLIPRR